MQRRSARLTLLLGSTMIAALPGIALGQQEEAPVELGEISVGMLGADAVGETTNPFTLTGVKTATPITEVPQSVSVVSREDLAETNAGKLDDALSYTAGVQGAPFGYDSDMNWIYSRGFDATQTGVFMDGLQLFSYAFGSYYIDPFLVERVEVLRGPSSMLYGASNPGGVVNYVSRLPDGEEGTNAELGADSEGRTWFSTETGGTAEGGLAYRFGTKTQRVDGHGAFDAGTEGAAYGGITKTFDDGSKMTLHLSYSGIGEDHVGGAWLPYQGKVEEASFGTFDEYFNTGEPGYDDYERQQVIGTAIYQRDLGPWAFKSTLRTAWADIAEEQVYAYNYDDATAELTRTAFSHDSEVATLQSDTNLERTVTFGGAEHELLFGLDLQRYTLDQAQSAASVDTLSAEDPDYGSQIGAIFSSTYLDEELTQTQAGLYAQDQIRWGEGWIATLNGRFDVVETEVDNALGEDRDRSDDAFTWRVGLAKEIGSVTPYAVAGTYFNPQSLSSPAQEDFEPETGRQVEAGVKWAPSDFTLVTFAAFENTRENLPQNRVDPSTGETEYDLFGEVRSRGVELEAKAELTPSLDLKGSLTHMEVEITEDGNPDRVGKTPPVVIEDKAALTLAWSPQSLPGLTLRGGARYNGSSWADYANTLEVPEVTLYDAGAQYDFESGWSANLNVSNLADEDYVTGCNSATECYQGEGRNVSLALRRSF